MENFSFASPEDYEIDYYTTLGRGAIASIYRATRRDGLSVAVKIYKMHVPQEIIFEEITNCIRIKQYCDANEKGWDGIIKILDVIDAGGEYKLVMERIDRGDLFSLCINHEQMPESFVAKYVHDIASACLRMQDGINMIHGDIKLENIGVVKQSASENGGLRIKLLDFGSSMIINDGEEENFKQGLVRMGRYGTEMLKAPEAFESNLFGPFSDVWAIGIVALILMERNYPFSADRETMISEIRNPNKIAMVLSKVHFNRFSLEAKAFIKQLLAFNVTERISLHEVVSHPWIQTFSSSNGSKTLSKSPPMSPITIVGNCNNNNNNTQANYVTINGINTIDKLYSM